MGVDYYDRELPGQVAARCVYDLDRILQFLQQTGFLLLSSASIFVVGMLVIVAIAPAAFPLIAVLVLLVAIIALVQLPIGNQAWNWARHELGTVTAKFEEDFVGPSRDPQPRRRRHPDQEVRRRVLAASPGQVVRADHPGGRHPDADLRGHHDPGARALAHRHAHARGHADHRDRAVGVPPRADVDRAAAPDRRVLQRASRGARVVGTAARAVRGADPPGDPSRRGRVPRAARRRHVRPRRVRVPADRSPGAARRVVHDPRAAPSPRWSATPAPGSRASPSSCRAPTTPPAAPSPSTASTCAT